MGRIVDEMIRGYAKGYLFGRMVVGCLFFIIFVLFVVVMVVLAVSSHLQSHLGGP